MFATPLCELAFKYGSDKCPKIKHHYTPFYWEMFKLQQHHEVRKLLEIGVGDQDEMRWTGVPGYVTGASLRMWRDFFPNAQIYGADIKPELVFKEDRIETFQCDQSQEADLLRVIEQTGTDLDVVIDDGSHRREHQVFTCRTLMPLLPKNVIYIIEDVGHPGEVSAQLPEYNCQVFRPRHMATHDDRLLIVRHNG